MPFSLGTRIKTRRFTHQRNITLLLGCGFNERLDVEACVAMGDSDVFYFAAAGVGGVGYFSRDGH